MSVQQTRAQHSATLAHMDALNRQAEQARAAITPEPLWVSALCTLGTVFAIVLMIAGWAVLS